MNEYLTIVIGIMLIYQAIMAFSGNDKSTRKMKGKYTPESLATFSKITGAGSLIAGVFFVYASLNQLGFLKIGPDFNNGNTSLIVYGIILAVLVVLLIIGYAVVLKPIDGAMRGKKKNIEDEDY